MLGVKVRATWCLPWRSTECSWRKTDMDTAKLHCVKCFYRNITKELEEKRTVNLGWGSDMWIKLGAISIFLYPQLCTQKDIKELFKYSDGTWKTSKRENWRELKIRVKNKQEKKPQEARGKNITHNVCHRYTCLNWDPKLGQSLSSGKHKKEWNISENMPSKEVRERHS